MFPARAFAPRYYPGRYFPKVGSDLAPPTPPLVTDSPDFTRTPSDAPRLAHALTGPVDLTHALTDSPAFVRR